MEDLVKIIQKINIPTNELNVEIIQEILIKAKRCRAIESKCGTGNDNYIWNELSSKLWKHLQEGFKNLDNQLLCATCFYTILPFTDKQNDYFNNILEIIQSEKCVQSNISLAVSLMYGLFQSSFFTHTIENTKLVSSVLESFFDLLLIMGYEYTKYTFLAYRIITSFKKVCGTNMEDAIFNSSNQIKLLNLVNHNWENPVTGVRDMNKSIFQTLIKIIDNATFQLIVEEINGFYWNKAKYLMLSKIIESRVNDIVGVATENGWVEGLMYSLHKPGLVSAGSDMYYVMLKQIKSEDDWCKIFMAPIVRILASVSNKAIENFNNYWCLTTFTKFPTLMNKLLQAVLKLDQTDQTFYSTLCLMKQGNKLGLLKKDWEENNNTTTETILNALDHSNTHVRMLAFDTVCIRHGKFLPCQMEYNLILQFLHNNVNTDSTVLRLAMIGSLNHFLTQLHIAFVNYIKNSSSIFVDNLINFCQNVQVFITESLNFNGNYQRKISTVKILNVIMNCWCEVPKKRKEQMKSNSITLLEFLKERKGWILNKSFVIKILHLLKDPSDDIRENVIKLILNHYSNEFKDANLLNNLKEEAFQCLRSKFFYEIDCGKSMLKLMVSLMLKDPSVEDCLRNVENVFSEGYIQLVTQNECKTNIMTSIQNGTQLNALISILYIVLESCILYGQKIKTSEETMNELLNALEEISNQFTWEQQSSTSSDFSKMNDMVQDIIIKSGYDVTNDNNDTKISGQHQIVLNCLWLNVKTSCDMASLLIQYNSKDIVTCERSLNILTHVLETSRHKGAIESAGAALGQAIQHLSSLPEESSASKLPYILLKSKLNDLIQQASNMASVTRRGAGLSIMVHRIVSSDMKKGKPLFNYFMEKILETCNKVEDVPNYEDITNIENQMDLPKAIYIHFLTKIVTDSSLATDVTYYSGKLVELAFNNLTSPHWQIRNAALQLYGALIPRQIGQKKDSGIDDETIATVACDELRTHSPKLWTFIISQLKSDHSHDKIQSHSNLVSVLNLLASSAKRYNFSFNMAEQKSSDEELLGCLVDLLGSPIYTVRRLTAKSIFNIYTFKIIYKVFMNPESLSENSLHGHLMLLKHCHKYYSSTNYDSYFSEIKERFSRFFAKKKHSYMCWEIFDDMFYSDNNLQSVDIKLTLKDNLAAGLPLWVELFVQKHIASGPWEEIPKILQKFTERNYFEKCCKCLIVKIECSETLPDNLLIEITNILFSFRNKYASSLLWKLLYQLSLKVDIDYLDISSLLNDSIGQSLPYTMRYILPLAGRLIQCSDKTMQGKLCQIIYKLTNPDEADVDMRYIAALANNEMANKFNQLHDRNKILLIRSAVNLFQDEDENVRNKSVIFYNEINRLQMPLHPFICLQRILDPKFLKSVFATPQDSVKVLTNDLSNLLHDNSSCSIDKYNPFANDSKNIYFEDEVLRMLIKKLSIVAY